MVLVQRFGKLENFLTMNCNLMWPIQETLLPNELSQNRPDLLTGVFKAKLELLKTEILKKQVLGLVTICIYVIEFQKIGLPHAHFLLIMKSQSKLLNCEAYDRLVCVEIPYET